MKVNWITSSRTSSGRVAIEHLAARTSIHKSGQGRNKPAFSMTLYLPLMRKMRALTKDRVDIGETETHFVLRRNPSGAYALSQTGSAKERKAGMLATCTVSIVRDKVGEFEPSEFLINEIVVDDNGLVFVPKFKTGIAA